MNEITNSSTRWYCHECLKMFSNGDGLLAVKVAPFQRHKTYAIIKNGEITVKLMAPAIDGKANQALLMWLSHEFKWPKESLSLAWGSKSRRKGVRIKKEYFQYEQAVLTISLLLRQN